MNQRYRCGGGDKNRQEQLRREIEQQIQEFLARGGHIQQLRGPACQPHNTVQIGALPINSIIT